MATSPYDPKPPDETLDDDIEILEVVGLDEDAPPVSGEALDDEVEVVFDEVPAAPDAVSAPVVETRVDPVAEHRERTVRLQADFENYKKRVERDRADHERHATGRLVARLLPVLDNFERAMAAAKTDDDGFVRGIALIQRQLLDELRREGLSPMQSEGLPFDPTLHEAVATEITDAYAPNTVVGELQRGYFFHERVLRAALVRVSLDPESGGAAPREES